MKLSSWPMQEEIWFIMWLWGSSLKSMKITWITSSGWPSLWLTLYRKCIFKTWACYVKDTGIYQLEVVEWKYSIMYILWNVEPSSFWSIFDPYLGIKVRKSQPLLHRYSPFFYRCVPMMRKSETKLLEFPFNPSLKGGMCRISEIQEQLPPLVPPCSKKAAKVKSWMPLW